MATTASRPENNMDTDQPDDDGAAGTVIVTNPRTGMEYADPLALIERRQALAAKQWRRARGLDTVPPTPADVIETGPFAGRCTFATTVWPPGSPFRVRLLAVRAVDLPADVRERLRAAGVGEWVDDDDEMVPLGPEMCMGQPGPTIAVDEIVGRLKATPTPAERRGQRAEGEAQRYPGL
jgi:hypothetical protein